MGMAQGEPKAVSFVEQLQLKWAQSGGLCGHAALGLPQWGGRIRHTVPGLSLLGWMKL